MRGGVFGDQRRRAGHRGCQASWGDASDCASMASPLCREGLAELVDRSPKPESCPHQMPAEVEALILGRALGSGWGRGLCCFSWNMLGWTR